MRKPEKLDIKIAVATHKAYQMPSDDIYLPLHVGANGKVPLGFQGDDTGENISELNPKFCELTGLYWLWKNVSGDYLGLAHYRRHFCLRKKSTKWASVLNTKEAQALCRQYDIIVPTKRHYVIETLASHYSHTHYKEHLELTREILRQKYPQYLSAYDSVLGKTSGYMFNMFIMRTDLVNDYCAFLFDVLFELDKHVDTSGYSAFQARYLGRVSEILFNVWLMKKCEDEPLMVKEIGYIHMEPVNWWKKGTSFLKAKFLGKKYEGSF